MSMNIVKDVLTNVLNAQRPATNIMLMFRTGLK